ncbi:MAG TPA: hypothetical protein VKV04_16830, partial [Verrucomicrobiae bacterium]|nr:hypothetical protein [Verrucomicrobiae bacterium]
MKFSIVQSPKSKVQGAAEGARTQKDFRRWRLDIGPGDEGVALVITLIMLSVITFLAVAFLVLSQRENASSTIALDQKTAHMAADTAFNRVCAELLVDAMVNTNFQSFGIKVSTNFINYNGFNPGLNPQNPTNVNYDRVVNSVNTPLNQAQWIANIASLEFNPRAPVFVTTNSGTGSNEFRFYYDVNRNGRFDTNGLWPIVVLDVAGNPAYLTTNGSGFFV